MNEVRVSTLLLALGNDLLGDDGVGWAAARQLKKRFTGIDVVESSEAGLALMEIMAGYRRALLLDSVQTGQCPAGTVLEFGPNDFRRVIAPSPHYAGMPEVLDMARRLRIPFPGEIKVLALEVVNPFDFQETFSPEVAGGLPRLVEKAAAILEEWKEEQICTNIP